MVASAMQPVLYAKGLKVPQVYLYARTTGRTFYQDIVREHTNPIPGPPQRVACWHGYRDPISPAPYVYSESGGGYVTLGSVEGSERLGSGYVCWAP